MASRQIEQEEDNTGSNVLTFRDEAVSVGRLFSWKRAMALEVRLAKIEVISLFISHFRF